MNKNKMTIFVACIFLLFFAFSCEALGNAIKLKGTAWYISEGYYREDLVLNEDNTFLWTQSNAGILSDQRQGEYLTFHSIVGNFSYTNLQLILKDEEGNLIENGKFTFRVDVTPYDKELNSIVLVGTTESTIYYYNSVTEETENE